MLLLFAVGCRSFDNFSRIENEPAPLPPELRNGFGRMAVVTLSRGPAPEEYDSSITPDSRMETQLVAVLGDAAGHMVANAANAALEHDFSRKKSTPPPGWQEVKSTKTGSSAPPTRSAPTRSNSNSGNNSTSTKPQHDSNPDKSGGNQHNNSRQHSQDDHSNDIGSEFAGALAGAAIIAVPVVAYGMVKAAVNAAKEIEARNGYALLRKTAEEVPMVPGIKVHLEELAQKEHIDNLMALPEPGEAASATSGLLRTNFAPVDTVLLLSPNEENIIVEKVGEVRFTARVRVSLIRTRDGAVLHADFLDYTSGVAPVSKWRAHGGSRLKSERRHAQELFAEALMEQFFGVDAQKN